MAEEQHDVEGRARAARAKGALLKPTVKIELLASRWLVWSHLISPLQRALHLVHRQLPLLDSFLQNPAIHVAASKDPALLGGSFMELEQADVPEVEALRDDTRRRCAPLVALAEDIKRAESDLQRRATGFSLDGFYGSLPQSLAGLVEFTYDANHHPSLRVREELLYEDPKYRGLFNEVCLQDVGDNDRKFFLNTPRMVRAESQLAIPMEFTDPAIDLLASMRVRPVTAREIEARLGGAVDVTAFDRFLTQGPPTRRNPRYLGKGVRVRYFGHACVLLQTSTTNVLIDPRFAFDRNDPLATLTFHDLPDFIDYVVLSHSHQDHFCSETLVQLRRRIGRVVVPRSNRGSISDPSMKLALKALGFANIAVADPLDAISFEDGEILSIPFPGEHCDLDIQSKHCAAVTLKGKTFLFLVDSDAVDPELYTRLAPFMKDVSAVFIGMECHGAPLSWLYGPVLSRPLVRRDDESRRGSGSNCERARHVIRAIGTPKVFVYAMGMEPWNRHLLGLEYEPDSIQIVESNRFVAECLESGMEAERFKGCREIEFPAKRSAVSAPTRQRRAV